MNLVTQIERVNVVEDCEERKCQILAKEQKGRGRQDQG